MLLGEYMKYLQYTKKLLLLIWSVSLGGLVHAQQIPQVSHFMYDNLRTNPGSAGSMDMVCLTGISRLGLVGIPGAQNNLIFSAEAPFKILGTKHGVGMSFYNDVIGYNKDINLQLAYAYRFTIGDGTLGVGLNVGLIEKNLDSPSWITSTGATDDSSIPVGGDNKMAFGLGAGMFYRTEDIYFGIAALNLNQPEIIQQTTSNQNNSESNYNLTPHVYVTSGYNMQLSNPAWELRPAVLLKSDLITTDLDANLTAMYNKKVWGGVSYRVAGAVVLMAGLEVFEGLKIGYSYDVQTTSLIRYTQGTHEIVANYCFKIGVEKAPQKYKSIRFL